MILHEATRQAVTMVTATAAMPERKWVLEHHIALTMKGPGSGDLCLR